MKILLSGATSFTGAYIARAFTEAGATVHATLTKTKSEYVDPLVKARMSFAGPHEWIENAAFGSDALINCIRLAGQTGAPYDVFINHGADIKGYRALDFDYLGSAAKGLHRAREVVATLKSSGAKGLIHSGTVFEPTAAREAMSPYGLSKHFVWQGLRYFCHLEKLRVAKVVIANPIGPLENEDRLVPVFAKAWRDSRRPQLVDSMQIFDQIPAPWLAAAYVRAATNLVAGGGKATGFDALTVSATASADGGRAGPSPAPEMACQEYRPSAYQLSHRALIDKLCAAVKKYSGREVGYDLKATAGGSSQPPPAPAVACVNDEPVPELLTAAAGDEFWKSWVESLKL